MTLWMRNQPSAHGVHGEPSGGDMGRTHASVSLTALLIAACQPISPPNPGAPSPVSSALPSATPTLSPLPVTSPTPASAPVTLPQPTPTPSGIRAVCVEDSRATVYGKVADQAGNLLDGVRITGRVSGALFSNGSDVLAVSSQLGSWGLDGSPIGAKVMIQATLPGYGTQLIEYRPGGNSIDGRTFDRCREAGQVPRLNFLVIFLPKT